MLGQNEGQQEEGRLAAAAALLDRNAVAVFKLAGEPSRHLPDPRRLKALCAAPAPLLDPPSC